MVKGKIITLSDVVFNICGENTEENYIFKMVKVREQNGSKVSTLHSKW